MCILQAVAYYCPCPDRNNPACPHHAELADVDGIEAGPRLTSGWWRRLSTELPTRDEWQPGRASWRYCAQHPDGRDGGGEACAIYAFSRTEEHHLCDRCRRGHLKVVKGEVYHPRKAGGNGPDGGGSGVSGYQKGGDVNLAYK